MPNTAEHLHAVAARESEGECVSGRHEVLIVDDDSSVRALISIIFERNGIEAKVAESGREAMALLARSGDRFCAVILDLDVPEPNGIQIAGFIGANHPTLPVIAISGHADLADRLRQKNLGSVVRLILHKPLNPALLVDYIHGDRCLRQEPPPSNEVRP